MPEIHINQPNAVVQNVTFVENYSEFVKSRFKTDLPGNGAALLHAAVGISGEVAELLEAWNRENIIEECGDLEFYIEAAWQQLPSRTGGTLHVNEPFTDALPYLVMYAGAFLDLAKKVWVYGKEVNALVAFNTLQDFEGHLAALYTFLGTTRKEVQRLNMEKLLKRYPTGYSDADAIARKDKE